MQCVSGSADGNREWVSVLGSGPGLRYGAKQSKFGREQAQGQKEEIPRAKYSIQLRSQ